MSVPAVWFAANQQPAPLSFQQHLPPDLLTRAELARRTGLQRTTITNIEEGRNLPSPGSIRRLQRVLVEARQPPPVLASPEFFAPTYAPLRLAAQMTTQLNAAGGSLDQVCLYLDYHSALDWLNASQEPEYERRYRTRIPLDQAAERMTSAGLPHGADVVGLGSGDGKCETRLTRHLAELLPQPPDLRLYLLDISHALIHTAYQHAIETLAGIPVFPIHGDLYELPRHPSFAHRASHDQRCRIWTFIGNTFANLTDEHRFVSDLGACAKPGDYAVIDVDVTWAPAEDLAAVRAADPVYSRAFPPSVERWLTGPVRRHCRGVKDVTIVAEPNNRLPVPGSYQNNFVGVVQMQDGSSRRYTLLRSKRYDPEALAHALGELGWERTEVWRFGPDPGRHALLLLRRV